MRLEYLFIKQNFLIMIQFRVNYFLSILYEFTELCITLLCYGVMFNYVESIAGWTQKQISFLAVYAYFVDVTCTMLFIGMVSIPDYIRSGTLDLFLLKPVEKQFFLTFRRPNSVQLIGFVGCVLYFVYYISSNKVPLVNTIVFTISAFCSLCCMYSVMLIIVSLSFWVVKIGDMWTLIYTFNSMGSKPIGIYPRVIRMILLSIIPSAIIINIPVMSLHSLEREFIWLESIVTLMFIFISRWIFKRGLARYESACG